MKVLVEGGKSKHCETVAYDPETNRVELIEQRLLPHRFETLNAQTYRDTAQAITDMVVRGAIANGATAAYGYAQGTKEFSGTDLESFRRHEAEVYEVLTKARPTAVDPINALKEMRRLCAAGSTVTEWQAIALAAAVEYSRRSVEGCRALGRLGAGLIAEGARVMTHCNAGWLACVDFGTATAPMYAAQEAGRRFHVYCSETRPRSQGASLTAWEMGQQGISHQVVTDNAAGHMMQRGMVDLVIVGSDRTLARTGEVANKIGTYMKAVLAKRHGIPFYVAIPLSTLDWELEKGDEIPIEDRGDEEVCGAWGSTSEGQLTYVRVASPGSRAFNPGFDVTPPELITGIITPVGILEPARLLEQRTELQLRLS